MATATQKRAGGSQGRSGSTTRGKARGGAAVRRSPWPLWLALIYLLVTVGLGTAARLLAERYWWSTLLLYFPQVAYLAPAPLVLFLALRKLDGRAFLVLLVTLGVILGPLMGFNLPGNGALAHPEVLVGRPRVRVMTYNIRGGMDGFDAISAQIQAFNPDVVVITEAQGWGREPKLRRELAEQFKGWHATQGGDVYLASRWPMVSRESERLGADPETQAISGRCKVRAHIVAPFGEFDLVGVHFYTALHGETLVNQRRRVPGYLRSAGAVRMDQAQDLVDWESDRGRPIIVAGDFNTPPAGHVYGLLSGPWQDAFSESGLGWGFTYPATFPLLRIDHIFHSADWRAVTSRVGNAPGSDHRPLLAELALMPSSNE